MLAAACSSDTTELFVQDEPFESEGPDSELADEEGAEAPPSDDAQEKWAHSTAFGWQGGEVTYSISFPAGVTQVGQLTTAQATTVINSAFQQWDPKVNLSFRKVNPGAEVLEIDFVPTAFINGRLGIGRPDQIWLASDVNWGTQQLNLSNVVLHEIGHSLAFEHSSVNNTAGAVPLMSPSIEAPGATVSGFTPDDMQAVAASVYVSWQDVSGGEGDRDIGSSVAGGAEQTWKLGTGTNSEGFKVFRWIETPPSWLQITGGGVRIDMAGRVAWVVTNLGKAKEKAGVSSGSPNGLGWTDRGNCGFVDIGANATGTVWAVGSGTAGSVTGDANGDFAIYRHNNSSGNTCTGWTLVTGKRARYIDVAPDGSA